MTQSVQMVVAKAIGAVLLAGIALAQDLKIYTEHPRLFLRPQRLRLLRREKERQSLRWEQFASLMAGKARMPEPGFAAALYYQVTGDRSAGQEAVKWALGPASDLRQLSLVFDWCQPVLDAEQARALAARLQRGLEQTATAKDVAAVRARVLAAVALAEHAPQLPETTLERVFQQWWRGEVAPALTGGRSVISRDELYPLLELMHALQDNLQLDLAEDVRVWCKQLPAYLLLSYYPTVYPAAENEYRIPAGGGAQVDLRRAALARAAELALLAYDPNAAESQYLQGWLMHDRFLLRSAFGITYELLWANPYHPGLSVYHLPPILHDELSGRLFLRASWDEGARWVGYWDGHLETFEQGQPRTVPLKPGSKPIQVRDTVVLPGANSGPWKPAGEVKVVFVVGLKPLGLYEVKADGQKTRGERAGRDGILELKFPAGLRGGIRVRESAPP